MVLPISLEVRSVSLCDDELFHLEEELSNCDVVTQTGAQKVSQGSSQKITCVAEEW